LKGILVKADGEIREAEFLSAMAVAEKVGCVPQRTSIADGYMMVHNHNTKLPLNRIAGSILDITVYGDAVIVRNAHRAPGVRMVSLDDMDVQQLALVLADAEEESKEKAALQCG
jgi:hypothetical protein